MKKLFAKKTKVIVEEDAAAAILNPETLAVNAEPSTAGELEKIIKTTDSMNIVSAIEGQETISPKKSKEELSNVREAIHRSFDLARRKIATEYEQIIVSGNFIDNQFLAVQVTVKNFEKKWNVEYVESVVKKFIDALPEQLSLGKTIMITPDLVIEPIIYVDKVLPSWKITPDFALLTNALKWQDVVNKLIEEGDLSQDAKDIIAELVDAISTNVKNGYYVKLARFIIVQVYPGSAQKIVLFSNDTLKKMNDIYTRFLKTGERKQINKFDTVAHYEKTRETIKAEYLSQDAKEVNEAPAFVPKDLTEEITEESSKDLDQKRILRNEIESITEAKDLEVEKNKGKKGKNQEVITKGAVLESDEEDEDTEYETGEIPGPSLVDAAMDGETLKDEPAPKPKKKPAAKAPAKKVAAPAPKPAAKVPAKKSGAKEKEIDLIGGIVNAKSKTPAKKPAAKAPVKAPAKAPAKKPVAKAPAKKPAKKK